MGTSLIPELLSFLKKEKIKMKQRKISDSEFWLESPDGFMTVKFILDDSAHEIFYDIFSPEYDVHLKEETLRDVEKLDFIAEETGKWKHEKSIEDFWLILDCVKLWGAKKQI